jgi:hypothetical protein
VLVLMTWAMDTRLLKFHLTPDHRSLYGYLQGLYSHTCCLDPVSVPRGGT